MPIPLDPILDILEDCDQCRKLLVARQPHAEKQRLPHVDRRPMWASKAKPVTKADRHQAKLAKMHSRKGPDQSGYAGNLTAHVKHAMPVANTTHLGLKNMFSHSDRVIQHLQQNNHISWTPMEGGQYTVIPSDKWQLGVEHVKEKFNLTADTHTTKHIPPQPLPLFLNGNGTRPRGEQTKFRGNQTIPVGKHTVRPRDDGAGFVAGYYVNYYRCYNDGSRASDAQIASFVPHACEKLIHMLDDLEKSTDTNKDINALQVFQTDTVPNVDGLPGYIRFSTQYTKGLNKFLATRAICEGVLNKFDTVCQNRPGAATQGGELFVTDSIKFNADPTQLDTNQ
ncbi:hypothetical protein MMC11_002752 [Xylographa trunciseda]|nr:hypothetical protein [Xylographa trunciseda]